MTLQTAKNKIKKSIRVETFSKMNGLKPKSNPGFIFGICYLDLNSMEDQNKFRNWFNKVRNRKTN